jgi:hypothetical protein
MISPSRPPSSPPLALAPQATKLLLTLVATALRRRKALVACTAGNLIVAEVLKLALSLLASHPEDS